MLRRVFILFFIFFTFVYQASAIENKYYTIKDDVWTFNELNKTEFKQLPKEEKKEYKNIKKGEKFFQKGNDANTKRKNAKQHYKNAIQKNPNLIPAYHNLAVVHLLDHEWHSAIIKAKYTLNSKTGVYPLMYYVLGYANYFLGNSEECYKNYSKFLSHEKAKNTLYEANPESLNIIYLQIAKSAYYIAINSKNKNYYEIAIKYANKIPENSMHYYDSIETKYTIYDYQNKNGLALAQAIKLTALKSTTENYMKIIKHTKDDNKKLSLYYKARNISTNIEEYAKINRIIIDEEQKRIDNSIKPIKGYTKKPNWLEIKNNCKYGNAQYWIQRQDKFFFNAFECRAEYKGNDLTKCYSNLITEQEKLTTQLIEEVRAQEERAFQQELIRQQQMANYYRAQNNYLQSQNNAIQRERNNIQRQGVYYQKKMYENTVRNNFYSL